MQTLWFTQKSMMVPRGGISIASGINFMLCGGALALAAETRFVLLFELLTFLAGVNGWLGFSFYLYGGTPLSPYGDMAVHTAGAFLLLSGGLLCLRTDGGLMALLVSESLGGEIARRLVPAVVILPIIMGFLSLQGQRWGWFGPEAGVSLLALTNALVFGGLIWANAHLLHRSDSDRKKAEEKILRLNADLEERVRVRTAEAMAANQDMEIFTYSVAHDLRAPLRHILAFGKILEEELGGTPPAAVLEALTTIRGATNEMAQLVDDLLQLSRLARHECKPESTSLDLLVRDLLREFKKETEGRTVEWRVEQLPIAKCDPELIKQVYWQLISNALKFSRLRSVAIIEIGCRAQDGRTVFFVRDNGVGFDMAYAGKLFGVFQRLHHRDQFEGTGTGLAAAERIIRQHGGRIWAEAAPDQGATFYFDFGSDANPPGNPQFREQANGI